MMLDMMWQEKMDLWDPGGMGGWADGGESRKGGGGGLKGGPK